MGVIHKLKPEVKEFILEQKNTIPHLSCRKLTALVLENFQIALSKSSINAIIKEAGLSAPVGRAPKKKKPHIVMPKLPELLEDASVKQLEIKTKAQEVESAANLEEELKQKQLEEAEKLKLAQLAEENKRQEEALRKSEEEKRAQEEAKAKEEEARKVEEEAAKKAEAEKWLKLAEEEKLREEAAKKAKEEEARIAREKASALEEERQKEELRKAEEEAVAKAEAAQNAAAEKQKILEEEEQRAREEAERSAQAKVAPVFAIDRFAQLKNSGIILLRATDALIGAGKLIAAAIKSKFPGAGENFEALTENIIYLPMLQDKLERPLVDKLAGYLDEMENIKVMNLDISRVITLALQEVRSVKIALSEGANFFLDAQFYSVWSSPHIPYDFTSSIHNLKSRINKYFNTDSPFILFNAPGYDIPSLEFFAFLAALEGRGAAINNLILYGNKFEELEVVPVSRTKKRSLIFCIWPWQFTECRKVRSIGEFRRFHLEEQKKDFYIADLEMDLRHAGSGKQASFTGCALKLNPGEKTRLVILSNFAPGAKKAEEIAALYLSRWPNLEEAFQDYSRKIELFTYTANSQRYFSADALNLKLSQVATVKDLFRDYLALLDGYVRWHLLPSGYEDQEFKVSQERFYDLGVNLTDNGAGSLADFVLPAEGYSFAKDLGYLCRRINEREVILDGKRFLINIE